MKINSDKSCITACDKSFAICYIVLLPSQVDLLGDEVDVLLHLLEKIYIALEHYSPVLQHYPGVREVTLLNVAFISMIYLLAFSEQRKFQCLIIDKFCNFL